MGERFQTGASVKVRLSKKHTLDGELVEHAAQFVRYHPPQNGGEPEWADVKLERHHSIDERSGHKIHTLSVPVAQVVAVLLLLFLFVAPASAQFLGYTSPQTVNARPFGPANVSCTGSPQTATVPNLGQSVHQAVFEAGSNPGSGSMVIQGSNDGGVTFQNISDVASLGLASNMINLRGDGYYGIVQISVNCPPGGTFSVYYTGTSVTPGAPTGSTQLTQYAKTIAFAAPSAVSLPNQGVQTPFGNTAGSIYFQYSAGTIAAGSTISVQCVLHTNEAVTLLSTVPVVATAAVFQQIPVPATNCPNVTVSYNSGGAGTANFNLDYIFYFPGQTPNLGSGTYTHVTSTTATAAKTTGGFLHTLTINLGAAGTVSIFDLPGASCTGTPAINQVAIVTATATTLQTFTYDVNLLQGICVKASVAMDLTVSTN